MATWYAELVPSHLERCLRLFFFFFFFFFRYSLLFSFVVAVSRATICHHLSINTCCTHILTVLELQECSVFFPSYSLYPPPPPHRSRSLSRWGISNFSLFSSLKPSFSLVVLNGLSLLISLKEKTILHCTSFCVHPFMCICRLSYCTSFSCDFTGQTEVLWEVLCWLLKQKSFF